MIRNHDAAGISYCDLFEDGERKRSDGPLGLLFFCSTKWKKLWDRPQGVHLGAARKVFCKPSRPSPRTGRHQRTRPPYAATFYPQAQLSPAFLRMKR